MLQDKQCSRYNSAPTWRTFLHPMNIWSGWILILFKGRSFAIVLFKAEELKKTCTNSDILYSTSLAAAVKIAKKPFNFFSLCLNSLCLIRVWTPWPSRKHQSPVTTRRSEYSFCFYRLHRAIIHPIPTNYAFSRTPALISPTSITMYAMNC